MLLSASIIASNINGSGSTSARLKRIAKRTFRSLYVHGRWFAAVLLGPGAMILPQVVHDEREDGTGRHHAAEEDVQEPGETAAG